MILNKSHFLKSVYCEDHFPHTVAQLINSKLDNIKLFGQYDKANDT